MVVFVSLVVLFVCGVSIGYGVRGFINRTGKAEEAKVLAEVAKVEADVKAEVNKL